MSISPEELDRQMQEQTVEAEYVEATDESPDLADSLSESIDMLKKCGLLFEFLSDPDFCKTISKRERDIMGRIIGKIYTFTAEKEAMLENLDEADDE